MIYVDIPVRDEERTIGVLLWKVRKVMAEFGRPYQVVVLDDASTDRTPEVLERYRDTLPLRIIRSDEHLGYGGALERLVRDVVERSSYPKRDVAVTIQGDFTEDPRDLVPMVKTIEGGADLVVGRAENSPRGTPTSQRVSRRLAPILLGRALRNAPVSDPLSGFRAYRVIVLKKALRALGARLPLVTSSAWGANLEILARTVPHARRIEESPISTGRAARERNSRFRMLHSLRSLTALRSTTWPAH